MKQVQLDKHEHTLRLEEGNIGTIEIVDLDGKGPYIYKAKSVHFNSPSEHKLNDHRMCLEMQILHDLVSGPHKASYHETQTIVAVLFEISDTTHTTIEKFQADFLGKVGEINLGDIFKDQTDYYHYKGSLTAPPALDVVNWFIMKNMLPINPHQLSNLHDHWHDKIGFTNFRVI